MLRGELFFLLVMLVLILVFGDKKLVYSLYRVLIVIFAILNFLKYRRIRFIDIWNLSFMYIVLYEITMFNENEILAFRESIFFVVFSNISVNLGYYLSKDKMSNRPKQLRKLKNPSKTLNLALVLAVVYFLSVIQESIVVFVSGRSSLGVDALGSSSVNFLTNIFTRISSVLPIIGAYIYKEYRVNRSGLILILIILLCAIPHVLFGTRFVLLYSLGLPLFFVFDKLRLSFGKLIIITGVLGSVVLLTGMMKNSRNVNSESEFSLLENIGSNENVVRGTSHIFMYLKHSDYSYGSESMFPLISFVPRSLWSSKPKQLSYWFVRTYWPTAPKGYSAAYGFWGELLMDFGYFALIILVILGSFMRRMEYDFYWFKKNGDYKVIVTSFAIPYLFFAVRSPQTSIIYLMGTLITYSIVSASIRKVRYYERFEKRKI